MARDRARRPRNLRSGSCASCARFPLARSGKPARQFNAAMSAYRTIEVKRIAGALGAEIHGVDLRQALADEAVAEIRRAFLEHLVIFFHDQDLTPAQYMAFARCMGKPIEYPFVKGIAGFPEMIEVKKLEHERHNFGGVWHSDTA